MRNEQDIKCIAYNQRATPSGGDNEHCSASPDVLTDEELENKANNNKKTPNDLLSIKTTDNIGIARVKLLLQYFRSLVSYAQIAFFAFITLVLVAIGIIAA